MPHIVSAVIEVAEGWDLATVIPALADLATATEAEPGCLMFGVRQFATTPTRFALWEIWTDEQALKDHFTYAHTRHVIDQGMTRVVTVDVLKDLTPSEE